jgi:hypothetical protein
MAGRVLEFLRPTPGGLILKVGACLVEIAALVVDIETLWTRVQLKLGIVSPSSVDP